MPAAEFIPSFHALFSHILCPDYPDPGFLWCDQLYPGSIIPCRNANLEVSRLHDYLKKCRRADDRK
jgi:hypothetical protein